jgi:hypothetical protein
MKLTPILLLIAIAFTPRVQAQENFQDGYVVTPGGDTLRGRIDFRDWAVNPGKIVFLDGRTGGRVEYSSGGMTAFGVREEVYRSYTVRLYPYSQDPAVVTVSSWTGQPYDTAIFLRRVTAGRLSLWGYRDSSDVVYFFIQTGRQTPVQLKIQNRVVRHGAASDVYTDKVYQYQLADYVSACSAIAERPVPVAYEENGLKALIDTYNQCGVEAGSKGKKRLVTVNILPMAGYLHSSVKPWGNTDAGYASWKAYVGPIGGLGFWLQPGRGSKALKRWGILIDGLYDQFLVKSNAIQVNYYQRYSGKMAYSEIRGDIQIRYAQPVGDFRPFLGAGFSNTLVINYESSQKLVDASNNTTISQPLFGTSGLEKKYRPGGFGVVGVAWKRWSLEVRYESIRPPGSRRR